MAPRRTQAQKEQWIAMNLERRQGGGSGPSTVAQHTSAADLELQRVIAAHDATKTALEDTKAQLHAESEHSKDLYQALRMERQKVSRNKAAKAHAQASATEAQSGVEQLEEQLEQLTLKNEQLELTMSELLEGWAMEKEVANETLQECRRRIRALQEKCRRSPEILKKAVARTQVEGQKFSLMDKGVYTEEARELCRVLVNAGCSQDFVGRVIEEVLTAAGISVVGPTMSGRTVARSILEGGIMADMQIGYEMSKTKGLTVSGDGTTHKNVGYEVRHVHMPVPTYELGDANVAKHRTRLVGVDSATDHSSQTQADGWKSKMQEKLDTYNQSPLAKRSQDALRLADFFARLQGMNSDHAKDQKKLAALLKEIKQTLTHESLGEGRLLEMSILEMQHLLTKATNEKITNAGGPLKWDALSDAEKLKADIDMMSAVVLKLGQEAYSTLPEDEKHRADFFIWVGCAMHKDLNCVKGGNSEMTAWWNENDEPGPILLANKDNAAVLEQAEDPDDYNAAEQRAHDVSSSGGVKLAGLAGLIFNNKNDKIGQQDVHQHFFLAKGIQTSKFPDTSNTRYQSYCAAAAVLITYLALYVEFMEWIRDGKDKSGFTNLEKNVYLGLQDIPTQTELSVLALYAQAISHPYMRNVRGPGTENINMLDLGPLHFKVEKHMEKVINDPSVLLPPHGSYESGTMDGEPWNNPEVVNAIYQLGPSLPHLKFVLVAFFKGALETWKRFTSEFQKGGLIDQATAEEKELARMPPTNDASEGALGALKSYLRRKPNTTMHQYNALAMFKFNGTAAFVHHVFVAEDHAYARQEARKKDSSHLERERKIALAESKDKHVAENKAKAALKAQQTAEKEARLAGINQIEAAEDVTINMTVAQLKDQLEIYRGLVDGIPKKTHLKTKAVMIEALKVAINQYNGLHGMDASQS
jgi:hypothetical protein